MYNCNKSICFTVSNIVNLNKVLICIKSFINPSERNNELLLITTICRFIGHCPVQYAIVDIFCLSLNIIKANNLMVAFCVSWWRYVSRLFAIQEVILWSIFALNFISCLKFPTLLFLWKTRPWRERSCIFRGIVKNICLFLAFSQITVSSKLSLT